MMRIYVRAIIAGMTGLLAAGAVHAQSYPAPIAEAVPEATGYVVVPDIVLPLSPKRHYKAMFEASKAPRDYAKPIAVLDRIGLQLNAMSVHKVPPENVVFKVIFYGPAADAILTNEKYQDAHKIDNPNLALIRRLQQAGVEFLVCGQYVARNRLTQSAFVPGTHIAEAATSVLISAANDGFALIAD